MAELPPLGPEVLTGDEIAALQTRAMKLGDELRGTSMKRHEINARELADWLPGQWVQYAASFGEGTNKSFAVSFDRQYRTINQGVVVYVGPDVRRAIRAYNDAR